MLKNIVRKNAYYDSVFLMSLTAQIKALDEVDDCAVMMATPANKEMLSERGLLTKESSGAQPGDLLVCLSLKDGVKTANVLKAIEDLWTQKVSVPSGTGEGHQPRSIDSAVDLLPDANIAVISVPGMYVKYIGMKALNRGLNLFIFSDNVSIEDEVLLKKEAIERGLLVMGPDCGTAIINGRAFGFANVVRKGNIGIISAAGTGLQELSVLLSNAGLGVSQGIGLGGRDLKEQIGGLSMLQAIKLLKSDDKTEIVVLLSKPPSPSVERKILDYVAGGKYVINFLGGNEAEAKKRGLVFANTIEQAAIEVAKLSGSGWEPPSIEAYRDVIRQAVNAVNKDGKGGKYLRGIFSGGTLCDESQIVLRGMLDEIYSNVPVPLMSKKLKNAWKSERHCIVDLGDDEFTRGRPHPMIDNTLRKERIVQEASDPDVAVILLDVVLGYGAHPDPAGELIRAIAQAQKIVSDDGRSLSFIAHVCGTQDDPQGLVPQEEKLKSAGVIVLPTNVLATKVAAGIIKGECEKKREGLT